MKTAISAMGCVCALGGGLEEIKNNIYNNSKGPQSVADRLESIYTKEYLCYTAPKDVLAFKREEESCGFLFSRYSIDVALKTAGLTIDSLKKIRVGMVMGTSVDASFNCFDFYKEFKSGNISSYQPLLHYFNTPLSGALQKYYALSGPQMTIANACTSGTDAMGIAAQWIEHDLCDVAIAGGCDEINIIPYLGFIRLMIAGKQPCAPFSLGRQGINLGEGAGVFILESDKFLKQRKAKPIGYLRGYGTCCDAYHATAPDPNGRGLKTALNMAMKAAGITKNDIAFINAHGTGTRDNDAAEAKIFNEVLKDVPVMASKSHTGHTLGAAGAVEAVLTLMALRERVIPKAANFLGEDPALNLIPVIKNTKIEGKNIALSDSLAFGGCNSVIVIETEGENE
jgi:3-oxoacyl-[acyl-carrier-protein] synthase-1/3-oxoacyl-[acyl-carrier-protein] synthase II